MEPLMSLDGYKVLQNAKQARALLNKYFEKEGYTVVAAKDDHDGSHPATHQKPEKSAGR
jgi:CheY-like chemotaxis protein